MAVTSKFQKFGLRRDKNLGDLENPDFALSNLLNDIAIVEEQGFLPEDIRVINNISTTRVTTDDFAELRGTNREYTPVGGGSPQILAPIVTIKDNIENFKVVTENPPASLGGTGPNAYFFPSSNLATESRIRADGDSRILTNDIIFGATNDPGVVGPLDFWENGSFDLGGKVYQDFQDPYGGILWEGYLSVVDTIKVSGSCFFHVEQDLFDDGNWKTVQSFYAPTRTVTIDTITGDGTFSTFTVSEEDIKYVMVGDYIDSNTNGPRVSEVDYSGLTVYVDSDITSEYSDTDSIDVYYDFVVADQYETDFVPLNRVSEFNRVKTRIGVWWIDPADYSDMPVLFYNNREIYFNNSGGGTFPYSNFYKDPSNGTPVEFSYRYFLENRLSFLNQNSDFAIETSQSFIIDYEPNLLFGDNTTTVSGGTAIDIESPGRGYLIAQENNTFANLEEGDWLVFHFDAAAGEEYYSLKIQEKESDTEVFVDESLFPHIVESNNAIEALAFKNIGLVGLYYTTDGLTLNEMDQGDIIPIEYVKKDNMFGFMEYGHDATNFAVISDNMLRISEVVNTTSSTAEITNEDFQGSSVAFSTNNRSIVAVYSHTGLTDLSGESECVGVYGVEVTSAASTGTNTVDVADTSQISVGDYVQYTSNTDTIVTTTVGTVNASSIVLDSNLQGDIPVNSTLILIDSSQPDPGSTDKSFCVLPLNTAPPFTSTPTGLATTSTSPDIVFTNRLTFENLKLTMTDAGDINTTSNTAYTETLPITSNNGTVYKFLIA